MNLIQRIKNIISILYSGFKINPIAIVIGIICIFFFFFNPIYILIKNRLQNLEFIIIANELIIGSTIYFSIYKNILKSRKTKSELKAIISNEMLDVKQKLFIYIGDIAIDDKNTEIIASNILSKYIENNNKFEKISSYFIDEIIAQYFSHISPGHQLFVKYILYELFPRYRSEFIDSLNGVDTTPGSAKYIFLQIYTYVVGSNRASKNILPIPLNKSINSELVDKIWKQVSSGNIGYYSTELKSASKHEALMAIAEKCIQKGYTTFSELLRLRNSNLPFKMLIKYDERFSFVEQNIVAKLSSTHSPNEVKLLLDMAKKIISPYPFSQAISQYDDVLIKLLPHDHFLYIIDMEKIKTKYNITTAQMLLSSTILPKAHKLHNGKIKRIRALDKTLRYFKKEFCANYYIMDIDIETLIVKADNKAVPAGFRKILIRDILDNGKLANLLSSQDIYLSSIIQSMPFEGMLFDTPSENIMEKYFKKYSKQIKLALDKNKLLHSSISDKCNLGKSVSLVSKLVYEIFLSEKGFPKVSRSDVKSTVQGITKNAKILNELICRKGLYLS